MSVLTEGQHQAEFIVSEQRISRDVVTVLSGQNLKAGHAVGIVTKGAVSGAAKAGGNTGDGTLTLDATTPKIAGAKPGVYQVRFITAITNSGRYQVIDPDGISLGTALVGATWANQIKFVIADGSTDFVVGDGFDITIAAGSGKVVEYDPDALDGRETPAGFLIGAVHADGADAEGLLLARNAEVNSAEVVWPTGTTDNEKAAAALLLKNLNIFVREAI